MRRKKQVNQDIRGYAKTKNVYLYEIADALGISIETFQRRLRYEMPTDEKENLIRTIDKIAEEYE